MKNISKKHLTEKLLPFWKSLKDDTYQGFYGMVDYDLTVHKTHEKGVILNSRILWFFSSAYLLTKDETDLLHATHAYNFLKNYAYDKENGGVYWSLNYDGTVLDDSKHTYNQAFAIYALSAYYEATNNKEVIGLATDIFNIIEEKCTAAIGYNEAFSKEFVLLSNEKLADNKELQERGIVSTKTMNSILHLLEAYTEFYKVTGNEKVKVALKNLLELTYNKICNHKLNQLDVFFDDNYNSLADIQSYGHDIEATWLLDRACEVLKDDKLTKDFASINTKITENVINKAFDGNSLYNEMCFGKLDKTKVWWVQAETVVGLLNEFEKNKDEKYLINAKKCFDFIMDKFVDKRPNSEWFYDLDGNNNVNKGPIVEPWKCPYHNGRMIFEIQRRNF